MQSTHTQFFVFKASVILAVISGCIYGATEYIQTGQLDDWLFMCLLSGATIFLCWGVQRLRKRATTFFSLLETGHVPADVSTAMPPEQIQKILDARNLLLSGITYGAMMGVTPFIFDIHADSPVLRFYLGVFLFWANFLTGGTFLVAYRLLCQTWGVSEKLGISFFNRRTEHATAYIKLTSGVTIVGAIYIGLCQISIVFSPFPMVTPYPLLMLIYAYIAFSCSAFAALYYVPQIPVRRQLAKERILILDQLGKEKSKLYEQVSEPGVAEAIVHLDALEQIVIKRGTGLSREKAILVNALLFLSGLIPTLLSVAQFGLDFLQLE